MVFIMYRKQFFLIYFVIKKYINLKKSVVHHEMNLKVQGTNNLFIIFQFTIANGFAVITKENNLWIYPQYGN